MMMTSDSITRKIEAIVKENDEIIKRIQRKTKDGSEIEGFQYIITYKRSDQDTQRDWFSVKEVKTTSYTEALSSWRVPENHELPTDPDPNKILYREQRDIMSMTCETFEDLVRLNKQVSVAVRYTTMLRESVSLEFGLKFKENFEIVQHLLGLLESYLIPKGSMLTQLQADISIVNTKLNEIYLKYPIVKETIYWDDSVNAEHLTFSPNKLIATLKGSSCCVRTPYFSTGEHIIKIKAIKVGHVGIGFAAQSKSLEPGLWIGSDSISGALWDNGFHHAGNTPVGGLREGDIITININFNTSKITMYQQETLLLHQSF